MNNFKSSLPLLIVGLLIVLFLKISAKKSNASSTKTSSKPVLVDSTLKYLRYSVELAEILSSKFNSPLLKDFALEIGSTNQEYTRNLVKRIIQNNWKANYQLPAEMKIRLRKGQVLSNQEVADFYFSEMDTQIKNLALLYKEEWQIDSTQFNKLPIIEDIYQQQIQFGKDVEDILQIKMHASL